MTKVHGKNTYVSINGTDLSQYGSNLEFNRSADSHDVTTFQNNSHRKLGGLFDGDMTLTGFYDNTAVSGPRATIEPLIGTVVLVVQRTEGTGVGRPTRAFGALVVTYKETEPVADYVTFEAELEFDGDVAVTTQ